MSTDPRMGLATAALRTDRNGNLAINDLLIAVASTVTAAGTTTLSAGSAGIQIFTGSTTQTVVLPSTYILAGQPYTIINTSTESVTVNASGGATVAVISPGAAAHLLALQATPTTPTHWTLLPTNDIPMVTRTATAGGTTILTASSTRVQQFTGSLGQTVQLPSTGIVAGQQYMIINTSVGGVIVQAADASAIGITLVGGRTATYVAKVDNPATSTDWNVIGGTISSNAGVGTIALRNSSGNLIADAFLAVKTSTVTAAGTTTLAIDSTQVQEFTGSTTQTVLLATTNIPAGFENRIINNSTGAVTVQSSGAETVAVLAAGTTAVFIALQDTPTTAAHWSVRLPWSATSAANTTVARDGNANIFADAFVRTVTSTATAAGATTLTIDSTAVQVFTGSSAQTVKLPTTSVAAGSQYAIINQSSGSVTVQASDGATIGLSLIGSRQAIYQARIDTPVTNSDWQVVGMTASSSAGVGTLMLRDASGNVTADNFIAAVTSTATAAGTTTLSIDSTRIQEFTGSSAQTVKLPTTSIAVGQIYTIVNNSSGTVTVQSSGANTIDTVAGGSAKIFLAQVNTPTTAANWRVFTPSA